MLPPILHPPVPPPVVITSGYTASRPNPLDPKRAPRPHLALDFAAPKGSSVLAAAAGKVERAYLSERGPIDPDTDLPRWYGYGNRVVIVHPGGYKTTYSHLLSMAVKKDDEVVQGQVIGYADNTGDSTGSHVHFELKNPDGHFIDPMPWMVCPSPMSVQPATIALPYTPTDGEPHA